MLPASRHAPSRSLTAVHLACLALSGLLVAAMLLAFARRVPFPYELEWMEGGTVVHVQRLMNGEALYARPSIDFVPFAYPPLYYFACVPLAALLGEGFAVPRLVSVIATLVTLAAIFVIVRRDSGFVPAAVASGTFAASYGLSDGWLDLARVDALYLAFMALAWWRAAVARRAGEWAIAGGLVWLAFLVKQPALLGVAPLAGYLVLADRRAAAWFLGPLAGLALASVAYFDWRSDGWFTYYVFELPRLRMRVSMEGERALSFLTSDLLRPLPLAVVLGAAGALALRRWRHAAFAAGLVGTAWVARLEGGAWNNAVLPAYLAVAVLFGLALTHLGRWTLPVTIAAALQLGWLLYDPRPFMPDAADRVAGKRFVTHLRELAGPVLVLDHSYWATLAGQREHAHGWAVTDVVWSDREKAGPQLEAEVREAISRRRFAAIVLDSGRSWFRRDVEGNYVLAGDLGTGTPSRPRSGAPRRPALVFVTPD